MNWNAERDVRMTGPVRGTRMATRPAVVAGTMALFLAAGCGFAGHGGSEADAGRSAAAPAPASVTNPAQGSPDSAAVVALLAGVRNAACPLAGVATGGQIAREHVAGLARAGFHTVLDLRAPDEARGFDESAAVTSAGLAYVTLPVTSATLGDSTFAAARSLLGDAGRYPILVHCASGNRVGVVMLPWLVLDRGWALADAEAAAEHGGMQDSPLRAMALDYIERHRAKH